MRTNSTHIGW